MSIGHPIARSGRSGMTFVEIVVATALLGVVSAAMFGMFSFATGMQLRQQRMLGCAEVANRQMLLYLDDPTKMDQAPKVVTYGTPDHQAKFRWEYREEPIQLIEANADARDQTHGSTLPTDRFLQVTVRSWLSEESGGSRFPDDSTPTVTLTRMLDPLYPRNPDSFMNMLQDPQGFQKFMGSMIGGNQGTAINGSGRNQNGRNGQGRGQFGPGGLNPNQAFGRGGQNGGRIPPGLFNGNGRGNGNGNARPPTVRPIGNSGSGSGGPR